MTVALISNSPKAILATYEGPPNLLRLPSGDIVSGAVVGWASAAYSLVAVTPFVTPTGYTNSGAPTYAFDGGGLVVETYPTTAINPVPQVVFMWQARAALQAAGLLVAADAAAAASADVSIQQFWQYSNTVNRTDVIMEAMAGVIGVTPEQLDALFITAATLTA